MKPKAHTESIEETATNAANHLEAALIGLYERAGNGSPINPRELLELISDAREIKRLLRKGA